MVATRHNRFGETTLGLVDRYLDELSPDGLYWDEMENVAFGTPLVTHDRPDGHTCSLDPETHTVLSQVGLTTLLAEKHRLAVVDHVRARGGTLMGNGPTATRRLLRKRIQRMVEIQHNDFWAYEGHLDTPLGHASESQDFSDVTRALEMATLPVKTWPEYEHEILPYLFPFTPIELHRGYLSGKERIITTHSGRYCWHGRNARGVVRYFDAEGNLRATDGPRGISSEHPAEICLEDREVAVIERLPVGGEPPNTFGRWQRRGRPSCCK